MRNNIVHQGAGELTYEIRGIVEVAEKIKSLGQEIYWENIGDPVAKGYQIPEWIKEIVKKSVDNNKSFAYNPTKGLLETREFLVKKEIPKTEPRLPPKIFAFSTDWATPSPKCTHILKRSSRHRSFARLFHSLVRRRRCTPAIPISLTIFCQKKLAP